MRRAGRQRSDGVGSLARFRPRAYALAYLACIPLFALLYMNWGGDFYHSTVQHEPELDQDAVAALTGVKVDLIGNFERAYGSPVLKVGGMQLDIRDITTDSLQTTSDEVTFRVMTPITYPADPEYGTTMTATTVHMGLAEFISSQAPTEDQATVMRFISFRRPILDTHNDESLSTKALFPVPEYFSAPEAGTSAVLLLSESTDRLLVGFAQAKEGFPEKASGQFSRMLYYSAITIATVGFGDIVPLTTRARILTMTEAILGIVLIGLFLNSLFQERLPPKPQAHGTKTRVGR